MQFDNSYSSGHYNYFQNVIFAYMRHFKFTMTHLDFILNSDIVLEIVCVFSTLLPGFKLLLLTFEVIIDHKILQIVC